MTIRNKECGDIFPGESVAVLRKILAGQILRGKRTPETTSKIKNWSKTIEGETAAAYLWEVIASLKGGKSKPVPPWLKSKFGRKEVLGFEC